MAWLVRLLTMWLVMRGLRTLVRYGPALAIRGAWVALWPSVLLAWGLHRHILPRAEHRWPRLRLVLVWGLRGVAVLGLVTALVVGEFVGLSPLQLAAGHATHTTLAVVAAPLGMATPVEAARLFIAGLPLSVVLALVLAGWWGWFARAVTGHRFGGKWGKGGAVTARDGEEPVPVDVQPRPLQSVARWDRSGPDWLVKHFFGRGLLAMFYAAAGVGKTELLFAMLRAAFDGVVFCGLATRRPQKALLLTEQDDETLEPTALRWGFALKPRDRLQELRWRWLPWEAPAGHVITMITASEMFARRADGRKPTWADACRHALGIALSQGYDVLVVDSLQRWMGADTRPQAMLDALAELRQGTRSRRGMRRLAVVVLHHPPRNGDHARGAGQIDGEVDMLWRVARRKGQPVTDPVRLLTFDKHRFQDEAPPLVEIERVYDPRRPDEPPYYQRIGSGAADEPPSPSETTVLPAPLPDTAGQRLSPQAQRVFHAATTLGAGRGTVAQLAKASGLPLNRTLEAVKVLCAARLLRVAGTVTPERGGKPTACYAVGSAQEGEAA